MKLLKDKYSIQLVIEKMNKSSVATIQSNLYYATKVFNTDTIVSESIESDPTESEYNEINGLLSIIEKELDKKGFELCNISAFINKGNDDPNIIDAASCRIQFTFDNQNGEGGVNYSLNDGNTIVKKINKLITNILRRIMKEQK